MKILILTYYFPPFNNIAALRMSKMAKYLMKSGHEVYVVCAGNNDSIPLLELEIPRENVLYTKDLSLNRFAVLHNQRKSAGHSSVSYSQNSESKGLKSAIVSLVKALIYFPDAFWGWIPFALLKATQVIKQQQPDIIYASSGPQSVLIVARVLAKRFKIPWIAELRDLWVDNHNYPFPSWRKPIDRILESLCLKNADRIVTVSRALADKLEKRYQKPVAAVLNGFEKDDYPDSSEVEFDQSNFSITLTGNIYKGRHKVPLLFEGIRKLDQKYIDKLRICYYGGTPGPLVVEAKRRELGELVEIHAPVSNKEALKAQKMADILLLFTWYNEAERGLYSGKIFEYIGSGRPILAVGPANVDLLDNNRFGVCLQNSEEISLQLEEWIEQKEKTGVVPATPKKFGEQYTRKNAALEIESIFRQVLSKTQ
jgi:glycosyltransferase involved in cell wall biosynthesis